jgi:hypothetical protein
LMLAKREKHGIMSDYRQLSFASNTILTEEHGT